MKDKSTKISFNSTITVLANGTGQNSRVRSGRSAVFTNTTFPFPIDFVSPFARRMIQGGAR